MKDGAERIHRRFSPSQRERNAGCPGSWKLLARTPPRPPSIWSIEGDKAHHVLEVSLRNGVRRALQGHREFSLYKSEDLDQGFGNNFYFSLQVALNHIYSILDEHPDAVLYLETEVEVPLEAAPGEGDGYCDICIYIPSIRTVYIIDYKHGAGVTKDINDNKQVRQYSTGVLFGPNPIVNPADVDEVIECIIQPRAFHKDGIIRECSVQPWEIECSIEDINNEVLACLDERAPLVPGEDQCRFCDANTTCPAREAMGLKVANNQFNQIRDVVTGTIPAPQDLDVNRLGYIFNAAPMLKKFLDDVEAHVYELKRSGVHVPGVKLVEPLARREYYGTENEVAFKLAALIGCPVTDVYEYKLMNITTAEKAVVEAYKSKVGRGKKKLAAEDAKHAFAFLTTKKPSNNLVLAREDDDRPDVSLSHRTYQQIGYVAPPPVVEE